MTKTILVLGGAGAQNSAVVHELSKEPSFAIKMLSRDVKTPEARALSVLPRVELVQGDCYDEDTLVLAFKGVHACFINTNGNAIGEKAEIFWGIRIYEIAYWAGVKHFVYSSLPYVSKKSGFNPKYRVPFTDGKAKVCEFIKAQPTDVMNWSFIESGPYPEHHLSSLWAPDKGPDGVYVFRTPIGPTGAIALVGLSDFAWYARYILAHPDEFKGDLLSVGIEHASGEDIATAFTKVTGEAARFEPLPLSTVAKAWPDNKLGTAGSPGYDDPTLKTMAETFVPWYTIWQESGGNVGLWTKDYERLDKIHPNRVRSVEEWMKSVGYGAERKPSILRTPLVPDISR